MKRSKRKNKLIVNCSHELCNSLISTSCMHEIDKLKCSSYITKFKARDPTISEHVINLFGDGFFGWGWKVRKRLELFVIDGIPSLSIDKT